MQFFTTIALLTSVASAAYNPCPNGKGKPVCCTLDVALGIDVLCIPRTLALSSRPIVVLLKSFLSAP